MTSTPKKSPYERYKSYIEKLKKSGGKLPINQFGDLNLAAIASACGNRRQWFSENRTKIMPDSDNQTLEMIIQNDMSQIGTEQKAGEDADVSLSQQHSASKRENSSLRKKIDQLTAQLNQLRSENEILKQEKKISKAESKEYFDAIEESGRSFKC